MIEYKELPNYVFEKKYDKYLFFYSNSFIGNDILLKNAFHSFLIKTQSDMVVRLYNSNTKNGPSNEIDLANYGLISNQNSHDSHFINGITEMPFLFITDKKGKWSIYTDTIFNLAIFAYDSKLSDLVSFFFINNPEIFKYENIENYIESNIFVFKDPKPFKEEFIRNYSNKIYSARSDSQD